MKRLVALLMFALLWGGASSSWAAAKTKPTPDKTRSWSVSLSTSRGRLGVLVMSMTDQLRAYFGVPADVGVLVSEVRDGSPAHQAGLKAGDVIIKVDGQRVEHPWDVRHALRGKGQGTRVAVELVRSKKRLKREVVLDADAPGAFKFKDFRFDLDLPTDLEELFDEDFGLRRFREHFGPGGSKSEPSPKHTPERWKLEDMRKRLREMERRLRKLERRFQRGGKT